MFLLGVSLCVAAVITGINIGGWSGLGVGVLLYLVGTYIGARGFAGPNRPASPSPSSRPARFRRQLATLRSWQRLKLARSSTTSTSPGEIIFTVGTLMVLVALILGLTGVLSGNVALLVGLISFLLAGAAYGGIR
ncbi:hypothetical protein ACFST9_20175 [Hymenobacter monticola]|uniref:hypothetical protein n=1 Tax=Hymenobacter monticola TaxID=1705399 RepID=UPI003644ECDF